MADVEPLFTGVIPALLTPFTKDGAVDTAAVPVLINHLIDKGASAFYLCGSSGEGLNMSVAERKDMAEAAINAVAGRVPCMVMVGACPIADAVELAQHAAKAGAKAISTTAPGIYAHLKLKDSDEPAPAFEATIAYFAEVAAATDLPFYGYWLGDIGNNDANQFLEAMKHVKTFAGLKFTNRDMYLFERLIDLAPTILGHRLNMISGPDECHLAAMAVGADAAIGTLYNMIPGFFVSLRAAFEKGDHATAREMQTRANRAIAIVLKAAKAGGKLSALASIKAFMRDCQGLPAGFCKAASLGEAWTAAVEEDFTKQFLELEKADGKLL